MTKMKVRNLNLNREEIDITKLKIPSNSAFYDVIKTLEGKYARNDRQDTYKKRQVK